ncbi:MAG: YihY/virulence factor BrkB family protein [bacterium]|nr:YihY/virulence factor BrkB family protein [bacterium]
MKSRPNTFGFYWWRIRRYLTFLWREYHNDRCAQAASALTFGTLLSIVPLFALMGWLTRPFHRDFSGLFQPMARFLAPTNELHELVRVNVAHYADNATALGLVGLLFFIVVAWSMTSSIELVINDIWHVRHRRGRIKKIVGFWVAVVMVPLLFIASATLNQLLERALIFGGLMEKPVTAWFLADLIPFLLLTASVSLAYWMLPHTIVRVKAAFAGGLVAAVLYHIVREGFAIYLRTFGTYDRIYGLLGVIPAFLIWLFLVWTVMLIGAEVAFTVQYPWDEELPP